MFFSFNSKFVKFLLTHESHNNSMLRTEIVVLIDTGPNMVDFN